MPDQPRDLVAGKYELISELGRGGMAVVWRAFAHGVEGFKRPVALKRIDPGFKEYPEVISMFVEEARVGAALRHPNIVQIHDFGMDESGEYFLITELVEGLHLGDYVKSFAGQPAGTPWPLVTAVMIEVLRALHAAHSRVGGDGKPAPVLHRDVTPPNILLDVNGTVKLADFGMARAMDRSRMTRPDVVKGKLSYLAPEMLLGVDPTARTDLFSLGVVMWEALSGRRLFDAPTDVEVLNLLRDARVPLLSMKRASLPLGLTRVVHQALERDPGRRFSSALAMLRALVKELRVLPESYDSMAIGESVVEARKRLAQPSKRAAPPKRS